MLVKLNNPDSQPGKLYWRTEDYDAAKNEGVVAGWWATES